MARALRTAAVVVGAVALIASGIGALAPAIGLAAKGSALLGALATVSKLATMTAAGRSLPARSARMPR